MEYEIKGVINQTLSVSLEAGEAFWASKGMIVSYDETIDWGVKTLGGVGRTVSRMLSGESLALAYITARDKGKVNFAAREPGRLVSWNLAEKGEVVALRGTFLAAYGDIDIRVTRAKRMGAMFFGGGGLLLQNISGTGLVFLSAKGDLVDTSLAEGESIVVSTGNLAAFSKSCDYKIRGVGGCLKMLFGGEGIFMTELTGPGRVLVQSLKRGTAEIKD
ncbi:MAG: TIGR00266 family protein [Planctomycetota bacterium]|jgi:uncharacterized protein (TIGR00266 family)